MASADQERYLLHLNMALAMESALVDHLEERARDAPLPAARERLELHRRETIEHRDRVRTIIQALGGSPTSGKASVQPPITPGLVGKMAQAMEAEKPDMQLMETLADYAVENYEAGLYKSLGLMAQKLGLSEHIRDFDRIREQEESMARFISSSAPELVSYAFPRAA